MSKQTKDGSAAEKQTIEQLQSRYQNLNTQKIEAETNLKHARAQLESLKKEAREKYGTDDVDALREKLATMTKENEDKRSKYQDDLDRIETDLAAVEEKFAESEKPTAEESST